MFYEESREDNEHLKSILQQAINDEAVAKREVCDLRAENSKLLEILMAKDERLSYLSLEIECLKKNEVAHIRELKRVYSGKSPMKMEIEGLPEGENNPTRKSKFDEIYDAKIQANKISTDTKKEHNKFHKREASLEYFTDNDSEYGDTYESKSDTGSPVSAGHHHHRRKSSTAFFSDSQEIFLSEDQDQELQSKNRRLIKRFADALRMKAFYKRGEQLEQPRQVK